ncbi:unnamed protein product, partial [Rangifer tarandus platyrhynchus]
MPDSKDDGAKPQGLGFPGSLLSPPPAPLSLSATRGREPLPCFSVVKIRAKGDSEE